MHDEQTGIHTEWILLSDHAEVINGKIYLMGGGWSVITANQEFPLQHQCGIAVAFSVPWNEANQVHPFSVEVLDADAEPLAKMEGELEVGRPPGIPLGTAQRVPMAINMTLGLAKPGAYVVKTRVHDQDSKTVRFIVVEGPGLMMARGMRQLGA